MIHSLRALLNQEEEMEELFDDEGVDEEFEIEGKGKMQDLSMLAIGRLGRSTLLMKADCQRTTPLTSPVFLPFVPPKQQRRTISSTRTLTNPVLMKNPPRTRKAC